MRHGVVAGVGGTLGVGLGDLELREQYRRHAVSLDTPSMKNNFRPRARKGGISLCAGETLSFDMALLQYDL
jgi:hypothetical protein